MPANTDTPIVVEALAVDNVRDVETNTIEKTSQSCNFVDISTHVEPSPPTPPPPPPPPPPIIKKTASTMTSDYNNKIYDEFLSESFENLLENDIYEYRNEIVDIEDPEKLQFTPRSMTFYR